MRRREFITGATTVGGTVLAGCAGLNEPKMEFQQFVVPDPNVVTVDEVDHEYFITIHNSGGSGHLNVELWYYQDSNTPDPPAASRYQYNTHDGRYFDLDRTFYFSSGERREESIVGSDNAPPPSEFPEYSMMVWPATYGAVFENTGATGEVEFRFEYRDTAGYFPEKPANKLEAVASDSTIEVVFDTIAPPYSEYEILAEPV